MSKIAMPYTVSADVLLPGDKLSIPPISVKTEKHLSFTCDIEDIGEGRVLVGHGKDVTAGSWVEISVKGVQAYTFYSYAEPNLKPLLSEPIPLPEGAFGYISVVIEANPLDRSNVLILSTAKAHVKTALDGWDGVAGDIFAMAEGVTLRNCKLNWSTDGFSRKIWILGDSYSGITYHMRWPYYLYRDGYNKNLISGYPGMSAESAIEEFRRFVENGAPEFVLWTLGMNNPDALGEINGDYKRATEEFISICEERGITPILATIPNVPERDHRPKNAWVRSLPYRYVDFARAVGSDKCVFWYSGMLSPDQVHPDELGAKSLYMQVLCDFPEIMQRSNS